MKAAITITDALSDKSLLGAALGDLTPWATWLAVLKAAFAEMMTAVELAAFHKVAGEREPPLHRVRELWAIVGRRSGKSRMAAALAVFLATMTDAHKRLAAGEQGYVLVLAPSQSQARVIFNYALGFIEASALLTSQINATTRDEIRLANGVTIACHPNSFRTVRGRTLLGCIFDESAFWRSEESANPDREVYRAALPALSTTHGMLIGIGSPYRRAGLLHQRHRDHFGQNTSGVLVVQGDSLTFNPTLDAEIVAAAEEDDPEAAQAEWHGLFRADISALLDDQIIDRAVDLSRPMELPPIRGKPYVCFHDPSGGRRDATALCIGHVEGKDKTFVADMVRGISAPHDPRQAVREFAVLAREYSVRRIYGDAYGGDWVSSAWQEFQLPYQRADLNRSEIYMEALPVFARGGLKMPNHGKLLKELRTLERRTHRSGRDSVDHGIGGHDDHANALCGAMWAATKRTITPSVGFVKGLY